MLAESRKRYDVDLTPRDLLHTGIVHITYLAKELQKKHTNDCSV